MAGAPRKSRYRDNAAGALNVEIIVNNFLRSYAAANVLLCLYSPESKRPKFVYRIYFRFREHNEGKSLAAKPFRPYKLIFYEAFLNRIDAKCRETYLKGSYGRKTIKGMLKKYSNEK